MNALGWRPPPLVDNTDTQYLGDQHWHQCWLFIFLFFLSICLSLYQSVCVSMHLFKINLKFLTTHDYWLAQLLYMSLVSGLELKTCKLRVENTQAVENTHLIKLNQSITPMNVYPYAKKHLHASKKSSSKKNSSKTK